MPGFFACHKNKGDLSSFQKLTGLFVVFSCECLILLPGKESKI